MNATTLRYRTEVGWLFQAGLVIFIATVAIGILNGLQVMTFSRDQLLTHVHAGTLGWAALGVFAALLWLFGGSVTTGSGDRYVRAVAALMALSTPLYIAAFYSGNLVARAVFGVPVLAAIVLFFGWLFVTVRRIGWSRISTVQFGAVLGVLVLIVGSALGVLIQIVLARGERLGGDAVGAHASAQTIGYNVLVSLALIDWQLAPRDERSKRAFIGSAFLAIGALIIAVALLAGNQQAAGGYLPFELIAVILFLTRLAGPWLRTRWSDVAGQRHFTIALPFVLLDVGLIMYLVVTVLILKVYTFETVPQGIFIASIHATMVGGMTNILFGLIGKLTRDRAHILGWADHVIFWGLNLGVAGFIVTLLLGTRELERYATSLMGAAILLAIVTFTARLRAPAPAVMERAVA